MMQRIVGGLDVACGSRHEQHLSSIGVDKMESYGRICQGNQERQRMEKEY